MKHDLCIRTILEAWHLPEFDQQEKEFKCRKPNVDGLKQPTQPGISTN